MPQTVPARTIPDDFHHIGGVSLPECGHFPSDGRISPLGLSKCCTHKFCGRVTIRMVAFSS